MKQVYAGVSAISGKGVIAAEPIRAGETICPVTGAIRRLSCRNRDEAMSFPDWIGIGKDLWIDPVGTVRYLNHSCAPNAGITGRIMPGRGSRRRGSYTLVARTDIHAGAEITIDYSLIEGDPLWEMACNCGQPQCRSVVGAVTSLTPERFRAYLPHVPDYFRQLYAQRQAH